MKAEWTNKDSLSIESTGQKAILVLDMPNECDECPCLNQKLWECQADIKRRSSDERPSWCPLKPLPEKLNSDSDCDEIDEYFEEKHGFTRHGCIYDVVNTWNACLDEIIGETE